MAVTANVDPTRRFSTFYMSEIYTGPNGTGIWVPNVNDMVIDWDNGIYKVVSVDHYKTNLCYMVKVNLNTLGGGLDDSDMAVVTGVGANSNSFRVYVNTETVPHTMAIDSRVIWNGGANAYVKVFRGTDYSETTGQCISAIITANGNITSENIPLVVVTIPSGTNVTQKTAQVAWCSEAVTNGDVVTVVTYTAAGTITSVDKFVVSVTNYIRSINQTAKYVTNIELITPFLSKTDKRLIECPINMVVQSLNFSAKVTYSDNSSIVSNIDGRKWNLAGLNMFVASQIGKYDRLLLTYTLDNTELAFDASEALPDRKVVREYRIRTIDIDTYYSIKLFAVPVWSTSARAYSLNWYLYNLAREDIIDVTAYIEYSTLSPTFVGNKYNSAQILDVAFNMQSLGQNYGYFRHVQRVAVTLLNPGTTVAPNRYFTIAYGDATLYGDTARALYTADELNAGKLKLNISCGYSDALTWITNVYRPLEPLYYSANEAEAPAPTHVRVLIGTGTSAWQREILIADITKDIRNINTSISQGGLVRIELFYRDEEGDHQLAIAPMVASVMQ